MRRTAATFAGLALMFGASIANAKPRLDVAHVQGKDAPWVVGWNEAVVTLDTGVDGLAFRGEVVIDSTYDRHGDSSATVRVPVSLAAGESARLLIPFFLNPGRYPSVALRTAAEGEIAAQSLTLTRPIESIASIVEIQGKDARGAKLIDIPSSPGGGFDDEGLIAPPGTIPPTFPPHGGGKGFHVPAPMPTVSPWLSGLMAQVVTVQTAKESGDPILPDVSGGWSGAAVVVVPSDILARLQGRPYESLEHWVLSGGVLAVSVVREEDLRGANLKALLGEEVHLTSATASPTLTFSGQNLTRGDVSKSGDDGDWATHGVGQVWLLRRDPWSRALDPKSAKSLYAIWEHAAIRRRSLISLPAGNGVRWYDDDRMRHYLDPNHGFRPALGAAAVLIVIYAILVGPLVFARARKLGRPLSVLKVTPLLALGLFLLLVGLGKLGKGFRGRARNLAVIDVGGGQTKGAATTLRAFYLPDASGIDLVATRPVDTVHVVDPFLDSGSIELDRGTLAVRGVRAHPWQTVVVAEEGARDVPGGIVLEGNGSRLTLINKTPWTLEHVVLHPETTPVAPAKSRYFEKVPPGGSVTLRDGIAVGRNVRPMQWEIQGSSKSPSPGIEPKDGNYDEAFDALGALVGGWQSTTAPGGADPLPTSQPIATCVVRTSGGKESGITIEKEAILIRVIGLGGGKGKGELEKDEPKGKEGNL
ncbi:MAG: hypothetical protein ACXVEF_43645 [Polyangiales bacterium]